MEAFIREKSQIGCSLTVFLYSSPRSNAHTFLHLSQCFGGPYFFSWCEHLWHFLPTKAAISLQYSQVLGLKCCGSQLKDKDPFVENIIYLFYNVEFC